MVVFEGLERRDGVVVNAKGRCAQDPAKLLVLGDEALELLHSLPLVLLHHLQTRATVLLHLQHGAAFLLLNTTQTKCVKRRGGSVKIKKATDPGGTVPQTGAAEVRCTKLWGPPDKPRCSSLICSWVLLPLRSLGPAIPAGQRGQHTWGCLCVDHKCVHNQFRGSPWCACGPRWSSERAALPESLFPPKCPAVWRAPCWDRPRTRQRVPH